MLYYSLTIFVGVWSPTNTILWFSSFHISFLPLTPFTPLLPCLVLWPYCLCWVSQNLQVQNIQTKNSVQQKINISSLSLKQRAAGFRRWGEVIRKASPVWLAAIQPAPIHRSKVISKKKITKKDTYIEREIIYIYAILTQTKLRKNSYHFKGKKNILDLITLFTLQFCFQPPQNAFCRFFFFNWRPATV